MWRRFTPRLARRRGSFDDQMRKGSWSPNAMMGTSASPSGVVSGAEMVQMLYRPLPPGHTVESEEDIHNVLVLHREYIAPRATNEGIAFDLAPVCPSPTELASGRQRIARSINSARMNAARVRGENAPRLEVSTHRDEAPGTVQAARYVLDEKQIRFCERSQRRLPPHISVEAALCVIEAAAIVAGAPDDAAREAWFARFLGLDRATLEKEREVALSAALDAEAQARAEAANGAAVPATLDAGRNKGDPSPAGASGNQDGDEPLPPPPLFIANQAASSSERPVVVPASVPSDFRDLYAGYAAYCSGAAPTFAPTEALARDVGRTGRHLERHRWRRLIERFVDEDAHFLRSVARGATVEGGQASAEAAAVEGALSADWHFTEGDLNDLQVLNGQLRTLKLLDARVGEAVKEAWHLQERGSGSSVAMNPKSTVQSNANPTRRVAATHDQWN